MRRLAPSAAVRLTACVALAAAIVACRRSEATPAGESAAARNVAAPGAVGAGGAPTDSVSAAADRGRIRGSDSAPVWLVEISDFQCPFCKRWHDESFAAIDKEYVQTGKIRLAYLNYPLSMHQHAQVAAETAMCASVQGKFWPLHESLFATQERWAAQRDPRPLFDSLAVAAGVNAGAWRSCMSSHATTALIDADRQRSSAAGVQSTPTFFVGDRKLEGAYPVDSFRVAIEGALAKAKPIRK